jgi:carbonic anhydrase
VQAALQGVRVGLADNWLQHVKDVRNCHSALLDSLPQAQRLDALCELNVIEQVVNVAHTTVLQDAWQRGQSVALHGWVYGLSDGLLKDLHVTVDGNENLAAAYRQAVESVAARPQAVG